MIMNTAFEEDVCGQVIGAYMLIGSVHYEGRKQGRDLYAESEEDLKALAEQYIQAQRAECGPAFRAIFPRDAWELRIHSG